MSIAYSGIHIDLYVHFILTWHFPRYQRQWNAEIYPETPAKDSLTIVQAFCLSNH